VLGGLLLSRVAHQVFQLIEHSPGLGQQLRSVLGRLLALLIAGIRLRAAARTARWRRFAGRASPATPDDPARYLARAFWLLSR